MKILRIPILSTNYLWLLYNYKKECIIIDPGSAIKILKILKKYKLTLKFILLTHNHNDHTGGIRELLQNFPKTIIYGPIETQNQGTTHIVSEKDSLTLLEKKFKIFNFPGHTPNHIGFYSPPWLFCGDTIFSAGCGTIFPGFEQEMYQSFLKIKNLPNETLIFGGHEYTLSNVTFALQILPKNQDIINYYHKTTKLRSKNKPTIPTKLKLELKINPFLRFDDFNLKKSLNLPVNLKEEWKIFATLRAKKNKFNQLNNFIY